MKKIVLAVSLLFCCLMAAEIRAAEGTYDALWPLSKQVIDIRDVAPPLPDLSGKTICEFANYRYRFDETFPVIRELLQQKYPDINIIPFEEFGDFGNAQDDRAAYAALRENIIAAGCQATISGNGC